jgi:conserved oligomeric Golgi complex subunit 3
MWYPTVRRTLACLSRLYRCVDRAIFQGLSQEALSACVQSIAEASTAIKAKKVGTVLTSLYLYPTEILLSKF